jgi:hypothetical protein
MSLRSGEKRLPVLLPWCKIGAAWNYQAVKAWGEKKRLVGVLDQATGEGYKFIPSTDPVFADRVSFF